MTVGRPGPDRIAPGVAPGGLVIDVYTLDGRRRVERALHPADPVEMFGEFDASRIVDDVVIVVFDGDTGARWTADDWRAYREAAGP